MLNRTSASRRERIPYKFLKNHVERIVDRHEESPGRIPGEIWFVCYGVGIWWHRFGRISTKLVRHWVGVGLYTRRVNDWEHAKAFKRQRVG